MNTAHATHHALQLLHNTRTIHIDTFWPVMHDNTNARQHQCMTTQNHRPIPTRFICASVSQGWQWLFIIESMPTFFLALWVWQTLSPSPAGCLFLTQSERAWLVGRCAERDSAKQSSGSRGTLGGALLEGKTWWMGGTGLMYTCAKYGGWTFFCFTGCHNHMCVFDCPDYPPPAM